MCQGRGCSPKGVNTKRCVNKDARPRRGWIWWGYHIDWRKERVLVRTLGPERVWIVISHIGWGGKRNTVYKSVETFPYQTRFKALRGYLEHTIDETLQYSHILIASLSMIETDSFRCLTKFALINIIHELIKV